MNIFLKIIMLVKSLFYSTFYAGKNLFGFSNSALTENPKVIISLTCYPARINTLFLTIESLLNQSFDFYRVVLYLSKEEFENISLPTSLQKLEKKGLIIKYVEGNLRSYKKLHYALSDYSNLPILTADDDVLYPKGWLRKFYDNHLISPNEILYARGHRIVLTDHGLPLPYDKFEEPDSGSSEMLVIPTGVSGILYPPGCFKEEVKNISTFMKILPNADDIWYRVMAIMNNVTCKLVYDRVIHFTPIIGTQATSLRKTNLANDCLNNDIQLKNILEYYKLNLKDFS
jgi:hypothetical protein